MKAFLSYLVVLAVAVSADSAVDESSSSNLRGEGGTAVRKMALQGLKRESDAKVDMHLTGDEQIIGERDLFGSCSATGRVCHLSRHNCCSRRCIPTMNESGDATNVGRCG